ncbi:hypothetical protein LPB87_12890 [Flavobacterium sp. EDS]|uniref:hypothetical protein n=1 Tax=Flavobacterium sp. EDS TaxID=2897328 RepID=UPI001E3BE85C|nr:hypothetical protein [Flavobacterium sp. EDS]MCD0475290.1 hypothetical protein [Flavobacterium sp. EDS]
MKTGPFFYEVIKLILDTYTDVNNVLCKNQFKVDCTTENQLVVKKNLRGRIMMAYENFLDKEVS